MQRGPKRRISEGNIGRGLNVNRRIKTPESEERGEAYYQICQDGRLREAGNQEGTKDKKLLFRHAFLQPTRVISWSRTCPFLLASSSILSQHTTEIGRLRMDKAAGPCISSGKFFSLFHLFAYDRTCTVPLLRSAPAPPITREQQ